MKIRRVSGILAIFIGIALISVSVADTFIPRDEKKHTSLGKYVNAREAYEMWKANPDKITIIDVRTPEEYVFIGHAPMAINIPLQVWNSKFDTDKKDVVLDENARFVTDIQKRYEPENTLMIMCRSGHRSAKGVEVLAKAGFKNVYNVIDGFEGDKVKDSESYFDGKRMRNGWKNSGNPWTFDLDLGLLPSLLKK